MLLRVWLVVPRTSKNLANLRILSDCRRSLPNTTGPFTPFPVRPRPGTAASALRWLEGCSFASVGWLTSWGTKMASASDRPTFSAPNISHCSFPKHWFFQRDVIGCPRLHCNLGAGFQTWIWDPSPRSESAILELNKLAECKPKEQATERLPETSEGSLWWGGNHRKKKSTMFLRAGKTSIFTRRQFKYLVSSRSFLTYLWFLFTCSRTQLCSSCASQMACRWSGGSNCLQPVHRCASSKCKVEQWWSRIIPNWA